MLHIYWKSIWQTINYDKQKMFLTLKKHFYFLINYLIREKAKYIQNLLKTYFLKPKLYYFFCFFTKLYLFFYIIFLQFLFSKNIIIFCLVYTWQSVHTMVSYQGNQLKNLRKIFQILAFGVFIFQMHQAILKYVSKPIVTEKLSETTTNIQKPLIYVCQENIIDTIKMRNNFCYPL